MHVQKICSAQSQKSDLQILQKKASSSSNGTSGQEPAIGGICIGVGRNKFAVAIGAKGSNVVELASSGGNKGGGTYGIGGFGAAPAAAGTDDRGGGGFGGGLGGGLGLAAALPDDGDAPL